METVNTMKPAWFLRTFAGISMDTGMSLLVYNLMRSSRLRPNTVPGVEAATA
jgi:cytochrome c oxidase cbb3-type subunit 1